MQEIPARAALVPAPDVADGLTTFVSRDEVKKAIQGSDGPLKLTLDVTRFADGVPADTRSVAVAWEKGDLEQLLRQTDGDRVALTFDGQALREAIESDVEAHGLREKAVVLAVAATAVTGITAGVAAGESSLAANDRAHAASAAVIQPSQDIDPLIGDAIRAEQAAPQLDPLIGDAIRADKAGSLGADDRALPRTDPTSQPSVSPDDRALPRTDPVAQPSLGPDDRALPRTAPAPVAAEPGLSPDDRALPRTDPVSQPSLGPDDRPLPRTDPLSEPQPVAGTSDDGTWIEAPSPGTVAVIGGIALAITGAAFAAGAASRRRVHPA
jgi:hypothetical protein